MHFGCPSSWRLRLLFLRNERERGLRFSFGGGCHSPAPPGDPPEGLQFCALLPTDEGFQAVGEIEELGVYGLGWYPI